MCIRDRWDLMKLCLIFCLYYSFRYNANPSLVLFLMHICNNFREIRNVIAYVVLCSCAYLLIIGSNLQVKSMVEGKDRRPELGYKLALELKKKLIAEEENEN